MAIPRQEKTVFARKPACGATKEGFQTSSSVGQVSLQILIFATVIVIMVTGFATWSGGLLNTSLHELNKLNAFQIAEAGIEYYRWHLAHAPNDFWDGNGATSTGPYAHDYYDQDGNLLGTFSLTITPPPQGSSVVTVRSTGALVNNFTVTKTIQVKMGITSFARYAIVVNQDVRFGSGTEISGEVMSNGGIRFDAFAHNLVQSAQQTYDDPDHGGANEHAVHTHVAPIDPLPPTPLPPRPDVFQAGRQMGVPAIDFTGLTQTLSNLKTKSQNGGYYATSSGVFGYDLLLNASGTFDLYKITALVPAPNGCQNTQNQSGWGTWSIQSETLVATGTMPGNGIFFIEDNAWVRGKINNARLTVGSAKFPDNPSTRTSITVNNDLTYTNYNASDTLALIAQEDFNVGLVSDDTLRVDAAIIAQNGRVGRYYYSPPNNQSQSNRCGPTVNRQQLTLYGSLVSNQRYGFGYVDETGYQVRNIIYDSNLLYNPPPSYPLTSTEYVQISWDEVQ